MPRRRWSTIFLLAVCTVLWSAGAHASLERDVQALVGFWAAFGKTARNEPRLAERGRWPVLNAVLAPANTKGCTTLAVLSHRNVRFQLVFRDPSRDPSRKEWPIPSVAGLAEVTRCGALQEALERAYVDVLSPRGAFEVVILRGAVRPPGATRALPHRHPGVVRPPPDVGPRPASAPPPSAAEGNAVTASRVANAAGVAEWKSVVPRGCHHFHAIADHVDGGVDLDLDLLTDDDALRASDRGAASEASTWLCLAYPQLLLARVFSSRAGTAVHLSRRTRAFPQGMPRRWGPTMREALARATIVRGLPTPRRAPERQLMGIGGVTELAFPVDDGTCYLAAAALTRGEAKVLGLSIAGLPYPSEASGDESDSSVALSFCSDRSDRIRAIVNASGERLAWLLAIWELSRTTAGGVVE